MDSKQNNYEYVRELISGMRYQSTSEAADSLEEVIKIIDSGDEEMAFIALKHSMRALLAIEVSRLRR